MGDSYCDRNAVNQILGTLRNNLVSRFERSENFHHVAHRRSPLYRDVDSLGTHPFHEAGLGRLYDRRSRHEKRRAGAAHGPHHFHEHPRIKNGFRLIHVGFESSMKESAMPEPGLVRSLALLSVSVIVFAAWAVADLGDGPAALAMVVAIAVSFLFVIHRLVPLALGF